jgi:hypothetical protein
LDDEVAKDFSKIDGGNKNHVSNTDVSVQHTIRQSIAHDQKRRKLTDGFSKVPGLKDFVINSFVQLVTRECAVCKKRAN